MPAPPDPRLADLLASLGFACRAGAIVVLVLAAWGDCRERRIANAASLWLLVLFGGAMLAAGSPARMLDGMLAGAGVLLAGLLLWRRRFIGGGDVKLLAATALWAGCADTPLLLLTTALSGGVIAVVVLAHGQLAAAGASTRPTVPYGVAIAAGGCTVLLHPFLLHHSLLLSPP